MGIYFGTRDTDSGSLRGSNASAGPSQAVVAKCGELQVYSKAANNKLDGEHALLPCAAAMCFGGLSEMQRMLALCLS